MNSISSLCLFCGSRPGADPAYVEAGRRLGSLMAERGIRLIYGGGNIGLMGVVAETVLAAGGEVTGIIPEFLMKYEVGDPGVTELIVVDDMHERKRRMFEMADGFVVLPGGLGTLDELIEVTTWKQLQLHAKPVVVIDVAGYWAPLKALIDGVIAGGFAHAAINELFTVVDGVDAVPSALETAPPPRRVVLTSHL
jgi:uncharacterized protein (TIGR00730 family)